MNKRFRIALAAVMAVALIVLAGCSGTTKADAEKSDNPDVWGYVASEDAAQLEVSEEQMGATELVVDRVLAPEDSWIVVHLDDNGKPGARIGLEAIDKGESTDVRVKLDEVMTDKVIVAVHADRATDDEFDFDMMNAKMSPDRPFFVNEKELAKVVKVREFGVKTEAGTAEIKVADQPGAASELIVDRALAPTDAWIVVHLDDDGAPGARVGLQPIPAGDNTNVTVELDPLPLTDKLFVAIHADRGAADLFEFDMMNKLNSPDQPFFVGEAEVATAVKVK